MAPQALCSLDREATEVECGVAWRATTPQEGTEPAVPSGLAAVPEAGARMRNPDVAKLLENIAGLLALKGENPFRVRAYSQAARSVASLTEDIADLWRQGRLCSVPGIGESIAAKIDEYLRTGRLSYYEQLKQEVAPQAAELLEVPGMGPARARLVYERLGVKTVRELEEAARQHRLSQLPGIRERTEEKILREIARLRQRTRRLLLGVALPAAEEVVGLLRDHSAVRSIDVAGSLRRLKETIGDIDILVASDHPSEVMDAFTTLPVVKEVLLVGPTKSSILTTSDLQIDLRVVHPDEYGSALQYFTGSKEHNIALRDVAIAKGYKLSEYGLFETRSGRRVAGATEEEVYHALGLDWIPPELRENRGEIAAAREGRLPRLVQLQDVKGDLQTHSDWSDGVNSLETMVRAARDRGYEYVAITDHSQGLGVAHGLSLDEIRQQRQLVEELNRRMAPFRILHGIELDIRADGTLDYPDEVLAGFDLVGASVHSAFDQPLERMTRRIVGALRNLFVCILNHPTGRLLGKRPPYAVDLDQVVKVAAEEGVVLEIDGQPDRLDLDDVWSRRAAEAGVVLACDTDSHAAGQLGFMRWAVAVARRAWLEPRHVLNAQPVESVLALRDRRRRRKAA